MSDTTPILYCANHPHVETSLRCNQCSKPICARCAIKTPTGYRCPQCVKGQQKIFETAEWYDYPLTFLIVVIFSLLGGWLTTFLGFLTPLLAGILVVLLTPPFGIAISEFVRKAINRRRARRLFQVAALTAVMGSLPFLMLSLINTFVGSRSFYSLLPLAWQVIYAFSLASTIYYRLRGIRI